MKFYDRNDLKTVIFEREFEDDSYYKWYLNVNLL